METAVIESLNQAVALEREAHTFRADQKIEEAFNAFDQAATLYREAGEHLKAALCYASAATCWNIRTGWQPLQNAATRSHLAADEAMKAGHYDYARALYLEAALLYEREGDFANYSACFYASKRADGKLSWELLTRRQKMVADRSSAQVRSRDRIVALIRWIFNSVHRLLWGYGERPFRAFGWGFAVIVASALVYAASGRVLTGGALHTISFSEAIYMSVITYTTVGYGDYLPVGWTRVFAVIEALSGIFFAPLFLIGLTRRYLRMYR